MSMDPSAHDTIRFEVTRQHRAAGPDFPVRRAPDQLVILLLHDGSGSTVEAADPRGSIVVTEAERPAVEAQLDELLASNADLSDGEWWYSVEAIDLTAETGPDAIRRTFASAYNLDERRADAAELSAEASRRQH